MAVSATFAVAITLGTLAAMFASVRGIGVLSTAFSFETPIIDAVHFAVPMSFTTRSAFYARVASTWSRRRGL
jgi:hypothetical protein